MNRFPILVAVLLIVGLTSCDSCKEKGPLIEFGNKVVSDSTYASSSIATPQKHYVVVEEFTGATCVNCPDARELLHQINEANEHRLLVMGIHPNGLGQATPVHGAKYDFRTDEGTKIKDIYFGDIPGLPSAGIDRVKIAGSRIFIKALWANAINDRLAKPAPVNIDLIPTYKAGDHKLDLEVKISYTQQLKGVQKLSLVIIEDSLIDKQEKPGSEIVENYVFMHTFRDYLTAVTGDPFLEQSSVKEPGTVFIRKYKNLEINKDWKAKNCKIIAFVHYDDADNIEIVQAAEVHMAE